MRQNRRLDGWCLGIEESGVKYLKGNFLPTRTFRDTADLNEQARRWVLEEAGVRIHGTTRQQPLERFGVEKPLMRSLPDVAPDLGSWHRLSLHRDCHVKLDYVLYSAPFTLVGQILWVRATDVSVSIFQDYRLVATHLRSHRPGDRRTVADHLPLEARAVRDKGIFTGGETFDSGDRRPASVSQTESRSSDTGELSRPCWDLSAPGRPETRQSRFQVLLQ